MSHEPHPPHQPLTFDTAAAHASTQVPVVSPTARAGEIWHSLKGRRYESATHLVVCDGDQFRGIVRIEEVLAAPREATVYSLMDAYPPVVAPGVDQEIAAWQAVRHRESALAVVDASGRYVGLIPPHRLLGVLLEEHEEDLARLGGFLHDTAAVRHASEESVPRRIWHRIPWLLLGLAGAFVAADLVGWFEVQLRAQVMLAFFLPGIVYLADAVGTQTETVIVRGLSVGVRLRQVVGRELLTGLVIWAALGLIACVLVWWRWEERELAVTVAVSLLAACSTATIAAMTLPWLLDRLGLDPAFGSGPLATVVQDLLSIVIYFVIATTVVG
jgi:magnesium transporter